MSEHQEKDNNYWSTSRVDELLRRVDEEGLDFKSVDNPFHDNNPDLKRSNILWEFTPEEIKEIDKCARDVTYFAKYCQVITDNGLAYINLRDYQESVLREYQSHRFNVFLAPRQVGKCLLPTSYVKRKNGEKVLIKDIKNQKNQGILICLKNFLYKIYNFI